jgi:signal transduction histidine kinase
MPSSPWMRKVLVRIGQIVLTTIVFAICHNIGGSFEIGNAVSILYPATAVSIVACMMFGPLAAIGVILGAILAPWTTDMDVRVIVLSGVVIAAQGLIPWAVFRMRRDLSIDLRDMKSLLAFLIFGVIVNTAVTAIIGDILLIPHPPGVLLVWREVFVWFIADFVAALLLATPILAFGGALLNRGRTETPRTITNALQIVTVIILLGFAASFAIRAYLMNRLEQDRVAQQRQFLEAQQHLHRLDAKNHPAPSLGNRDPEVAKRLEAARRIMLVTTLIDAMVFLILVLATVILLYTISRPFAQLRRAIRAMREGDELDTGRIDSRYSEFRSIAETLQETSTELRRREEELRHQTEKALLASQHKSEFLARMSHELRTPLNSIIGFSDLLTEQEATISTPKRLGFLENVRNSARHLLTMINDLLDIAKVESGKMELHFSDLDLRVSIANTIASTQSLFVRRGQHVEVITPDEPMLMRGDAGRIEQVLLNLLSNANKFSPEGGTITVRGEGEPGAWRIDVVDRGIGISPEDQKRIFDEFEQVSMRVVHATGTGLGLALARRFVEAHGGTISVESAIGTGSTFSVRLPRS